jgi:hypothetical protein
MPPRIACPDSDQWYDLLDGACSERERTALAGHLEDCRDCQKSLEELTATGDVSPLKRSLEHIQASPGPGLRRVIQELKRESTTIEPCTLPNAPAPMDLSFLTATEKPESLGRVGDHEVLDVLGRGGMGVVLKGFDAGLNRFVAIKVLAPHWAGSESARQRFNREAHATAAVKHDHVITIHGVSEISGLPYLVMEYVPGCSLQERLDREGPLEVEEIVRIGMQTAAGLVAAHEQGLIHRDVKPGNILLEDAIGRVKLSDFGLARAVDDATLTQSGVIAGTPHYMAPEQARGEALDHRADLFGLGCVLYALCTGRPPFSGDNTLAVIRRVCDEEPDPIRAINPAIPRWLVGMIDRLLAKKPEDRFESATEVAELLGQYLAFLRHPDLVTPPRLQPAPKTASSSGRRRHGLLIGLGIGAAAVSLVVWLGFGPLGFVKIGQKEAENLPGPPVIPPAPAPVVGEQKPAGAKVVLSNGRKILGARAPGLTYAVDYRFEQGGPEKDAQYVWTMRSQRKVYIAQTLSGTQLAHEGTLSGSTFFPPTPFDGAVEAFLEIQKVVPGEGARRERISEPIQIDPFRAVPESFRFGP